MVMKCNKRPRVLFCAGSSGSGKTLISCGIMQALMNRGKKITSFKCGPDYIDPMFHSKVIGTKSRNLDSFFTDSFTLNYLLCENSKESDLSVIEGVMGYYDGLGGYELKASTFDIAYNTQTPAILIVDCKGMSLSICAQVKGFVDFVKDSHGDSRIEGVILNRISPMVYDRIKEKIENTCHVKVFGYVPVLEDVVIESRHLGLVLPEEVENLREKLNKLAAVLEKTVDIDGIIGLAQNARDIWVDEYYMEHLCQEYNILEPPLKDELKIAVAEDEAFCFFYADNLMMLEKMGAKLCYFSPIRDKKLPDDICGLILYGGYPELHLDALSKNTEMLRDIKNRCEAGLPLLAECGGFMYLHEEIEDMEGAFHKGVGLIKGKAYRTPKLSRFGYINLTQNNDKFFCEENPNVFPAHEFHYFDTTNPGNDFHAQKPAGKKNWECIHTTETMLCGFPHFYYFGNPKLPNTFIKKCIEYKQNYNQNYKQNFLKE